MMKVGQLLSLAAPDVNVADELHPIYQEAMARLRRDAPPMSVEAMRATLERELGPIGHAFARFDWKPLAAASIGQVHAAWLHDGSRVAVKIQYPGAAAAIDADAKNVELLTSMLAMLIACMPAPINPDVRGAAQELCACFREELDYRTEMANQATFAALYRGHPFIHVPEVVHELCSGRVLCQELAEGLTWEQALTASQELRNSWAEAIWRFVYGSYARFGLLHADPHPGNYLFHEDGSVTFLDFGCVRRFRERARAMKTIGTACVDEDDPLGTWRACLELGFVQPSAPVAPEQLHAYWRGALEMYWREQPYTITPVHAAKWRKHRVSPPGEQLAVVRHWTLPPHYTMLSRVETAVNSVFAQLYASNDWRCIASEYFSGTDRPTPMGKLDREFFGEDSSESV